MRAAILFLITSVMIGCGGIDEAPVEAKATALDRQLPIADSIQVNNIDQVDILFGQPSDPTCACAAGSHKNEPSGACFAEFTCVSSDACDPRFVGPSITLDGVWNNGWRALRPPTEAHRS